MERRLALIFILATVLIDSIGIGLIFPVMPELLQSVTGASLGDAALWGGVLATAFAAMQFLFGPVVGNLSDRYGRRPVMLAALAVMVVDYAIMALAGSVWLLLAGRVVAGIAASTYATANAYMADITRPEDRARMFGLIGAAFGLGFVAGPLLGGIASTVSVRAPFWAAAGIAGANLALGLWALPESLAAENRRGFSWRRANPLGALAAITHLPGMLRFLAINFLFALAYTTYSSVWSFYAAEQFGWNGYWNGLSLAAFGVGMALTQGLLVGPAIRAWGERRTAATGMSLDVVAYVFYAFVRSGFWAMAFTPLAALAMVAGPALQGLMSGATPDDQQGELQGVVSSTTAVAAGLAPLLHTGIFWYFTRPGAPVHFPGAPFLLGAALTLACVALLVTAPALRKGGAT